MKNWLRSFAPRASLVKAVDLADTVPQGPKRWSFDPDSQEFIYGHEHTTHIHPGTVGLDYNSLHSMARIPVIGAIIQTRVNQVAEFAQPQPTPYSVGYQIRLKDRKAKMTKAAERRADEISSVIQRAGGPYWLGGFESFLRTVTRDSLTYDQANFEVIRDRAGAPWGFVPVDPATIRKAQPSEEALKRGTYKPDEIAYVQFMQNRVVNEWSREELAFGVRRPRSWVHANGYGYPELEELMKTITMLLNAETFNAANFTNGIHTRTILGLKSTMTEEMFKAFRREVVAMMSGVGNARRIPIIQLDPEFKEELAAIPMDRSAREMEYREWLNWLLKVCTSGFGMDPAELGFVFGNEGATGGMQGSNIMDRIIASKERGLFPLLRALAYWLNIWVVQPLHEDFVLEFVGYNAQTEEQRNTLDAQAVQHWETVDEVRARRDMPPLPDKKGEIILNATWQQAASQAAMLDQAGGEGPFGEEGEGEFDMNEFGVPGEEGEMAETGQGEEGEALERSQNRAHGEVEAVWELAGDLTRSYGQRLGALSAAFRKAGK